MAVKIEGLQQVLANIEEFRGEMGSSAIRDGVRAAAKVYAEAERETAPLLDHKTANSTSLDPGAIKEDIRITPVSKDEVGVVHVFVGPGKKTRHVAGWVEWGHRLIKGGYSKVLPTGKLRGPGREVGQVRPYPFLRQAYEQSQVSAIDAFVVAAAKRLKRWMR